jgi:tubulin-specific chaperone B
LKKKKFKNLKISQNNKELTLQTKTGEEIAILEEEEKTLQQYKIEETEKYKIKAKSNEAENKKIRYIFNETEEVKKFEISEEDYNKREDTFRKFKQKFIDPQKVAPTYIHTNLNNAAVGDRCLVIKTGTRGVVMFVGNTSFAPGMWIGGYFINFLLFFLFLNFFFYFFKTFFFVSTFFLFLSLTFCSSS